MTPPVRLREVLDLPDGATTPRGIAVAVNGQVIPRSQHATPNSPKAQGGDRDGGAGG